MPSPTDPEDENSEEARSRLSEGLRNCRAVLSGYRALLAGEGTEAAGENGFTETGEPDEPAAG